MNTEKRLTALEDKLGDQPKIRAQADRLNKLSTDEVTAVLNQMSDEEAKAVVAAMDLEAVVNWIGNTPRREHTRVLALASNEQLQELLRVAKEIREVGAVDLSKFSDQEIEEINAGDWSGDQIRARAKELGTI